MSQTRLSLSVGSIVLAAILAACGGKNGSSPDEHGDGHAPKGASAPASFKEGQGLQLAAETAEALG